MIIKSPETMFKSKVLFEINVEGLVSPLSSILEFLLIGILAFGARPDSLFSLQVQRNKLQSISIAQNDWYPSLQKRLQLIKYQINIQS